MRIVIVEDEAPIREGIAKILHKINPEYELAGKAVDGEEGYQLIKNIEPDLVIMDIRMPKMDGLTMLEKLRAENNQCRVLILSAYSDFNYARQAIELHIDNYLLKPVKIHELKRALQQVEEVLEKEEGREYVFTADSIILGCLYGQLKPNKTLEMMTREKYGFSLEDPGEVFVLWLGNGYEKQKADARQLLEEVDAHSLKFASCIIESDSWQMLIMVLYRISPGESHYSYFQNSVVPMLCSNLKEPVVCIWSSMDKILDLPEAVRKIRGDREWNLLFEKGTLICSEDAGKVKTVPLKHPAELEDKACRAARKGDREGIGECYKMLFAYYHEAPHLPSDIKQSVIHFSWAVVNAYNETKKVGADLRIQNILQSIVEAVSWEQIRRSLEEFLEILNVNVAKQEEVPMNVLVQKTQQMIKRYYDQGITLEEIANKLFVSEEYLSTLFKKETGVTFSETIRKYRIEKVKELLLDTHLKLNQIAELAGYSDPKYMSKVFKEEVGMLPNEFRKETH